MRLLILACLFLVSCDYTGEDIKKAQDFCKPHGGISLIIGTVSLGDKKVKCNDNSVVKLNEIAE